MSKSVRLKNNTYIDSSSISHNRVSLVNILNGKGIAKREGNSDSRIKSRSSWYEEKYTNLPTFSTSNNKIFQDSGDGGIKVLQAGWYIVSGTINIDLNNNAASIVMLSSMGHHQIVDVGTSGGMVSMNFPATAFYFNANTIIWLGYRIDNSTYDYLTRGGRSNMTMISI